MRSSAFACKFPNRTHEILELRKFYPPALGAAAFFLVLATGWLVWKLRTARQQ